MAHSPIFRNAPHPRSQTAGHRGLKQGAELRRGGGIRARGKFEGTPDTITALPGLKRRYRPVFAWKPAPDARLVRSHTPDPPAGCGSLCKACVPAIAMRKPAGRLGDRLKNICNSRHRTAMPSNWSAASSHDTGCRNTVSGAPRRIALEHRAHGSNPLAPQAEATDLRYIRSPEKRYPNA